MDKLFQEGRIADLSLRNKFIRAGCFEGMSQDGQVTDALIEHHRRLAAGGVAMTTVAYCSVSHDGRAFDHELWMRPEILPGLQRLTRAIHDEGAAASIQLGHCGYFANKKVIGKRPLGASPKYNLFQQAYCREMTPEDIKEKTDDFVSAAVMAREAGFDAIEIHAGHGYLLSQFLSPYTNKRQDDFGGNFENRISFPSSVVHNCRKALGDGFPILIKMNIEDGFPSGLIQEDSVKVAMAFEEAGASAIIPSAGFTSKTPFYMLRGNLPVKEMVRNQKSLIRKIGLALFGRFMVQEYSFDPLFLLEGARQIKNAVNIPVIYIGGARKRREIVALIEEGFAFIQLGRPTIHNPDFVNDLQSGKIIASDCDHCNRCVAAMDAGGVYCVTNAEGR